MDRRARDMRRSSFLLRIMPKRELVPRDSAYEVRDLVVNRLDGVPFRPTANGRQRTGNIPA